MKSYGLAKSAWGKLAIDVGAVRWHLDPDFVMHVVTKSVFCPGTMYQWDG